MRPISHDLRTRIVQMRQAGHSAADISALLGVCARSVQRYYRAFLDTGTVDTLKLGKPKGSKLDKHQVMISAWIKQSPSLTLEEICARLEHEQQVSVHHTTLLRVLRRWGFRYKKTIFAKEQKRPDVVERRQHWKAQMKDWSGPQLVFIDESGINTKMARLYGRSMGSERCIDHIAYGHWHTNTFIAALWHDRLTAPMLLDGPMNSDTFLEYITSTLIPTLKSGDIVICDNLSSHKNKAVAEALAKVGARIEYLPAYSPDLNPIEMAFAKIKSYLKAHTPNSFEEIVQRLKEAIDSFDHTICKNLFKHANYATM